MQEFWNINKLGKMEKTFLPEKCPHCSTEIVIGKSGGPGKKGLGILANYPCKHFLLYSDCWDNRIQDTEANKTESVLKCECGEDSANTTHSDWCPKHQKYKENFNEFRQGASDIS